MVSVSTIVQRIGSITQRLPFTAELGPIIALGIAAIGTLAFVDIASDVHEGDVEAFDSEILLALRLASDTSTPIGPVWLQNAVADLTALGGYAILTVLVLASVIYLLAVGKRVSALLVFGSITSGAILSSVLKIGFARVRPDLVEHLTHAASSSFPSGHATLSAIAYLTLGALMARAHPQKRVKGIILGGAIILTMIVGASRVYLGVHWPSDVLAGWSLGAAWAALWWWLAGVIDRDTTRAQRIYDRAEGQGMVGQEGLEPPTRPL